MDEELELALEPEIEIEEGTEQVRGSGTLYIVATPIGNSRDMSPRGKQILEEADLIAAEDTRRSMVLLNKLGIRNKLVSNHKFNEYGKAKHFITQLQEGKSIAVITDAGTPCISDPGNELIKAAVEAGIRGRAEAAAGKAAPGGYPDLCPLRKPQAHHGPGGLLHCRAGGCAPVPLQRHDQAPRDELSRHPRGGQGAAAGQGQL